MSAALREAAQAVVDAFKHEGPYQPHDRRYWLGDPPWDEDIVKAWEQAHGHDARLPCYEEHGCLLLVGEDDVLALVEALEHALAAADEQAALDRAVLEAAGPLALTMEAVGRYGLYAPYSQPFLDAVRARRAAGGGS